VSLPIILLAIVAAIVVGIFQSSLFEWTFHRYWLHRPWEPKGIFNAHTMVHHQLCKFEDTFHVHDEEQHEALHFQWWGGPVLVGINTVPWILLSVGLWALGVPFPYVAFVGTLAGTIFVYYLGYETLHYQMHKPTIAAVTKSPYFRFIEKHHRIHHVHMDRNLNVLFPLADLLLGTLVTKEEPSGPTPATARTLARRHSLYGRRLRGEAPWPEGSERVETAAPQASETLQK